MNHGFQRCAVDHSTFIKKQSNDCVFLAVYVDYILLTDSDSTGINEINEYLRKYFITKDMDRPRYFLRNEFAYGHGRMELSQRNYALDLIQETSLLGCKSENTPID